MSIGHGVVREREQKREVETGQGKGKEQWQIESERNSSVPTVHKINFRTEQEYHWEKVIKTLFLGYHNM